MAPRERLDFARDGTNWPNREHSRFVSAGGLTWHVQVAGAGPAILLVHGTGAATHSWRDVLPVLARSHTVVAPDLPGHGFSSAPRLAGYSLGGMARSLGALLHALDIQPALAVGHSAGAAVLARLAIDGALPARRLVGWNAAVLPLSGLAGRVFSPMAKVLAGLPFVPHVFARSAASPDAVDRLLRDTGSTIDGRGRALYTQLVQTPGHVAAALQMMANWDLNALARDLPRLATPLTLIVGAADRTVPPHHAEQVRALLPGTEVVSLPRLGHLAHEERPDEAAALIAARL